jgi:hypothetical protein
MKATIYTNNADHFTAVFSKDKEIENNYFQLDEE